MSSIKRILLVLGLVAAILPLTVGRSWAQSEVTQDFQQSYPLAANGRISLENINGSVHISTWDQNEVKVVAVKRAYRQERLDEVQIKIEANADSLRIKSEYPNRRQDFYSDGDRKLDNPASVEYTLTVPRNARLDSVELINGDLELNSLGGDIRASCINGNIKATGLSGDVRLSTINSELHASFAALSEAKSVALNSVNGRVIVTLPSDANAQLKAETIHGTIANDFGIPVRDGKYFGHNLSALLGNGGARVKLSNVNGGVTIGRASDGKTPSRVTNLLTATSNNDDDVDVDNDKDNDSDEDAASALVDAQNDLREAQRELDQASREMNQHRAELERAVAEARRAAENGSDEAKEAAREAEAELREAQRDAERDRRDAAREVAEAERQIRELSKNREAQAISRDAQREVERADREGQREAERAARDIQRDVQRVTRDAQREIERAKTSGTWENGSNLRAVERENKSFTVGGSPRVNVETFDGSVSVRSWDKAEVSYTLVKRAENDEQLRGVKFTANQSGDTITIKAEFDKSFARHIGNNYSANATASLEIMVPRQAAVRAATGDGNVRVEGINGDVEARTGDGSISVSEGQGRVTMQTGDGRIGLNNFRGEVEAKTGDGNISLEGQFSKVSASTGDGAIALAVPAGTNATIETNNDEVLGDGVELVQQGGATRGTRRWNLGSGGAIFSLRTGDGRITVRRSNPSN
ncbi:MAG: DUF4097 family beta strand repeat-containing protein [Pyrinomonadaceae bacterium]